MANDSGNVPVPPPGTTAVKKSHVGLIVGAVVVLGLLWMMAGGGHSSGGAGGGGTATGGENTTAADASPGGNPLFGKWSLVDPADAAYCPTTQEFTPDTSKSTSNGQTSQMKPIYDIQEGGQRVTVGYGTSYIGNWTVNGPDDLTLGQVGPPPYGVATFCKYHRM
jgi:hypothetical protein